MNIKQKICLLIGILLFVLMGIYPPWTLSPPRGGIIAQGYSFILNPPQTFALIDTSRLYPQWIMVMVVTAGLIVTFKG